MARKIVENTLLVSSWDQADDTLRRIGELTMLIRTKQDQAQLEKNEITERLKTAVAPLDEELKKLESGLKTFAQQEFIKKDFKSRALNFGSVFFRQRTGLRTLKKWTWKTCAEALQKIGLPEYLKISYEICRDELRHSNVGDEALASIGLERYSERPFTYELDETKFERTDTTDLPRAGESPAS